MKRRPHWRKENQCVMNRQQSTSISGKHHPENHKAQGGVEHTERVAPSDQSRAVRCNAAFIPPAG